ncbi:hypothetical protein LL962_16780 [Xanthomonas sp. NCPPB 1067]|uniref:hypothetical protein n=1 Tax=Xanthomonas sp. NCPPB 1067 TaxID=487524 RepID=UPI001E56307B|nr:hypothetical protein [Xanthomonas sp. NCPPB 1067]MCC4588736.1 hypothetical protein [Xanthomonas sp. NCPPB 1067]
MSIQQSAKLISNGDQRVESLTKREEFAKAAMQGIIGCAYHQDGYERVSRYAAMHDMQVIHWVARASVELADALLAELEKRA